MHVVLPYFQFWILLMAFAQAMPPLDSARDDSPLISTDSENKDLITNTGQPITLTCKANYPIAWNYTLNDERLPLPKIDSWFFPQNEHPYESNFTLQNPKYKDTGYYMCIAKNGTKHSSVYVYVKDDDHVLTKEVPYDFLTVIQHKSVIIPCRPCSPDVTVSLVLNSEEEITPSESSSVTYDPRVGFTIKEALISQHSGLYMCTATNGAKTETSFWELLVLSECKQVSKPEIISEIETVAMKGQNFTLQCKATSDIGVPFEQKWTVPDPHALESGHIAIGELKLSKKTINGIQYQEAVLPLHMYNANINDKGYYTCTVTAHSRKSNNASYFITVLDHQWEVDDNFTL